MLWFLHGLPWEHNLICVVTVTFGHICSSFAESVKKHLTYEIGNIMICDFATPFTEGELDAS